MQNEKIKYFSMFTGVGGFELGIEEGGKCIGFSEIDKYANQLLAKRFPEIPNFGDCTKIEADKLPDFDMLCGGFPCQSFSIAGKRRGFQDTRGTMFLHIARILEVKRPKIVWLENVKGLLNHDKGETFRVIIQTLSELGYDVQWMVLNSKFHGVPQNRERVFIIGSLRGTSRPEILPFTTINREINEQDKEARQIIQVDDVARENKNKLGDRLKMDGTSFTLNSIEQRGIIENGMNWLGRDVKTGKDGKNPLQEANRIYETNGVIQTVKKTPLKIKESPDTIMDINQAQRVYSTEGQSITIKGLGGGQGAKTGLYAVSNSSAREFKWQTEICPTILGRDYKEPKIVNFGFKIRRLTPIECERLQGFPDNWTEGFSDTQRYKMMGNAVTVNVIKAIASKLFVIPKQGVTK